MSLLQLQKRPKIVATDIDGTLTIPGESGLHPQLINGLFRLRANGIKVILVTGRPAGWVQGLFRYLPVAAAIAEGGAVLFAGNEKPQAHPLAANSSRSVRMEMLEQLKIKWPQLEETEDNAFRLVDAAFDRAPFNAKDLAEIRKQLASHQEVQFTYSTVHGHLMPAGVHKASGIQAMLALHPEFFGCTTTDVLTVGDSPNDDEMFEPGLFPNSVGVAGIRLHETEFRWLPRTRTNADACEGFLELIDHIEKI